MADILATEERLSSRHAEVREVATRLFYENSYNGTSLKQIAQVLGLRAPSLYNHISSKQQLLSDLMFDNTLTLRRVFDEAVASSTDVIEQIRHAAEAHIRHSARRHHQVHVGMHEMASLEEPSKSALLKLRAENGRRWRELVEKAAAEGRCRTRRPDLAAQSIIDLGAGVARWYRASEMDEDDLVDFYGHLALQIVEAEGTANNR
jgi:AcrR family transcriptional regulator